MGAVDGPGGLSEEDVQKFVADTHDLRVAGEDKDTGKTQFKVVKKGFWGRVWAKITGNPFETVVLKFLDQAPKKDAVSPQEEAFYKALSARMGKLQEKRKGDTKREAKIEHVSNRLGVHTGHSDKKDLTVYI